MRLLQLNLWGGRLMDNVAALADRLCPDIICFQEVISTKVPMVFGTLEDFQAQLEFSTEFFAPTFHFQIMGDDAEFGNAILARYPILHTDTVFIKNEYIRDFNFRIHDYNIRNFQLAVIDTPAGPLNVINFHGIQFPGHKNGTAETEKQCADLAAYIEWQNGPVILAGDFNLAPTSASLKPVNALLANQPMAAGLDSTRTIFSTKTEVCDYVFTSAEVRIRRFAKDDALVSDHSALVLDFELWS